MTLHTCQVVSVSAVVPHLIVIFAWDYPLSILHTLKAQEIDPVHFLDKVNCQSTRLVILEEFIFLATQNLPHCGQHVRVYFRFSWYNICALCVQGTGGRLKLELLLLIFMAGNGAGKDLSAVIACADE